MVKIRENHDFEYYINRKYGRLTIISKGKIVLYTGCTRLYVICKCDCGNTKEIVLDSLRTGSTTSCGCYNLEKVTKHNNTSNGIISDEYNIWHGMIQRCRNTNNKDYISYGGRGINVCSEWINSFENFIAYMGKRPSKEHSIDRMNNDGNYEPGNCQWSTKKEQSMNRRNNVFIEYNGISKIIPEWSKEINIPTSTIRYKLNKGLTPEQIFNKT